jgi:hypothetical protein
LSHLKRAVRVKDAMPNRVEHSSIGWAAELHDGLTHARMREIESSARPQLLADLGTRCPASIARSLSPFLPLARGRTSHVVGRR